MIYYFENTKNLIEKYNVAVDNCMKLCEDRDKKDIELLNTIDIEMAKALIADWDEHAVRVAKIILAHHDVNEIRVKFE